MIIYLIIALIVLTVFMTLEFVVGTSSGEQRWLAITAYIVAAALFPITLGIILYGIYRTHEKNKRRNKE